MYNAVLNRPEVFIGKKVHKEILMTLKSKELHSVAVSFITHSSN